MVDKIEEMALNDGIVGLYDKEKAMERVNAINKMEAIAEGLTEGLAKGKIKGKIEGKAEGKIEGKIIAKKEIAKNMVDEGMSIDLIKKITGLSKEEIEKLK